jgi:hypothetical protein
MVDLLEVRIFIRSLSLAYKGIGLAMCLSRSVVNHKVKAEKEFRLLGFAIIYQVIAGEVGQVSVIGDNLDSMWGVFQKRAPFFEGSDDCEKFFVINLIINLGWGMLP